MRKIIIYALFFLSVFLILLCDNSFIKSSGFYFIFFHFFLGLILVGNKGVRLLSPISIIYFYTTLSLAIGSWGFSRGYIIQRNLEEGFLAWNNSNISLSIILLFTSLFIIFGERYLPKDLPKIKFKDVSSLKYFISTIVFLPFFFFDIDLAPLGGSGSLSKVPKILFALATILFFQKFKPSLRLVGYFFLILLMATVSINEKREAIFLVLPILYLETIRNKLILNLKNSFLLSLIFFYCLILILAMSIARGYGGFGQFDSIFNTFAIIPDYISSDIFIGGLLLNIEVNYVYFHSLNSIELIINNPSLLSFGSTILKAFFIIIPRSIVHFKPDSIITLYTMNYDPGFRSVGGSFPINIFAEFFWNFHLFGILLNILLILFCYTLYKNLFRVIKISSFPKMLFYFVAYFNLLTLARGSGLDLYVLFLFLSSFFIIIYFILESLTIKQK